MRRGSLSNGRHSVKALLLLCAAILIGAAGLTFVSDQADAREAFARQTGKACAHCHTAAPKLNPVGNKFKANGFKL